MSKSKNITLWIIQTLLALLFIFTGTLKLVLPLDVLMAQTPLPGLAIRLIGLLELIGAFGLILPGIFKMSKGLTSRAALGLIILMIAAAISTVVTMGWILAILPIVIGALLIPIACGRWPTDISPFMNRAIWIVFVFLTVVVVFVSFFGLQK